MRKYWRENISIEITKLPMITKGDQTLNSGGKQGPQKTNKMRLSEDANVSRKSSRPTDRAGTDKGRVLQRISGEAALSELVARGKVAGKRSTCFTPRKKKSLY